MDRVLVIGGINLDIKAKTLALHVPATSNPSQILSKPGGVGRNIAHNLARLGVATSLLSIVGNDAQGDSVLAATAAAGVDVAPVEKVNVATGIYLALLDVSGELVTAASDMEPLDHLTPEVVKRHATVIRQSRFVIADCNLPVGTLTAIADLASDRLIIEPVSVSKCEKLKTLLRSHRVFLATPNLDQIEALTGTRSEAAAARNLHALGLANVVIHAGARGAFIADGEEFTLVPSQARVIRDVTGAGDAATAGLVAGLMQGMPLARAAGYGQEIAAKVIASEFSTLE
jgi:pseudouridine kinase